MVHQNIHVRPEHRLEKFRRAAASRRRKILSRSRVFEKLNYGKVAAVFWYPEKKDVVRIFLKNEFQDKLAPHEFFKYRKQGIEPTEIPEEVRKDIINIVLNASNDELFNITVLPDFKYTPVKGSFNKAKCELCGEYVFERYLRVKDGKKVCISCSERTNEEVIIHIPEIERG